MKSLLNVFALSTALFCIVACESTQKGIELISDDAQRKIDVLYNGRLFTSFIYPADLEKQSLYPIYTANGTEITRGFPLDPRPGERPDHPHHVGAWFTFGDVNGVDLWGNSTSVPADQKHLYGFVRHRNIVSLQSGKTQGILEVEADWVDHAEKFLLKEETKYVFSGEGDWRIIERITKLTAGKDTVTFTDNKEGMIGIRMDRVFEEPTNQPERFFDAQGNLGARAMNNEGKNGVYRNSEGFEKGAVWGKPTKWVSLSAEKDGEKISVAIIDHKKNPGYPAHSHARGYGLFSTNNMGAQAFNEDTHLFKLKLTPWQSTTFRHLIVVKTNGFVSDDEMNQMFADFNQ